MLRFVIQAVVAVTSEGTKSGGGWLELLKVAIGALGPVLAAVIAATAGVLITHRYTSLREKAERRAVNARHRKDLEALQKRHDLDKESEWRSHAVELTKLEVQRKLEIWKATEVDKRHKPRPAILDFLANYRDLVELDKSTPKALYLKILSDRITQLTDEDLKTLSPTEAEAVAAKQAELSSVEATGGEGHAGDAATNARPVQVPEQSATSEPNQELDGREVDEGGHNV